MSAQPAQPGFSAPPVQAEHRPCLHPTGGLEAEARELLAELTADTPSSTAASSTPPEGAAPGERGADISGGGARRVGCGSAPGRVNLIGEHVDYAGGLCLPFALPQRTLCLAARRTDGLVRIGSLLPSSDTARGEGLETVNASGDAKARIPQPSVAEIPVGDIGPGSPSDWSAYAAGVAYTLAEAGIIARADLEDGVTLALASSVPLGAGLSSSAAVELATAAALWDLYRGDPGGGEGTATAERSRVWPGPNDIAMVLVDACIRAENDIAGAATGGLDQTISLFGAEGQALLLDMGEGTRIPVPLDLPAAGVTVLVMDTNAPHRLHDGQYASRRGLIDLLMEGLGTTAPHRSGRGIVDDAIAWALGEGYEAVSQALKSELSADALTAVVRRRFGHIVTESQRTQELAHLLTEHPDLDEDTCRRAGELLNASHDSLRDDYEVSCPELDSAVDAARAAGAYGARMTGGGFGGSAIALVPTPAVVTVRDAVAAAAAEKGLAAPTFYEVTPSEGALTGR